MGVVPLYIQEAGVDFLPVNIILIRKIITVLELLRNFGN